MSKNVIVSHKFSGNRICLFLFFLLQMMMVVFAEVFTRVATVWDFYDTITHDWKTSQFHSDP